MISPTLLEIARCPRSGQRLSLAGGAIVEELNAARSRGALAFEAAVPQLDFDTPIEAALVTEDGTGCYAVQNGIPILLPDHRISL